MGGYRREREGGREGGREGRGGRKEGELDSEEVGMEGDEAKN